MISVNIWTWKNRRQTAANVVNYARKERRAVTMARLWKAMAKKNKQNQANNKQENPQSKNRQNSFENKKECPGKNSNDCPRGQQEYR